ncbi:MAG: agmatine deiminase family protein [Deltaproteobacteria bacterium]|nr:agmatine deiminase family protein [Deltaproteobacteria bacterium]
MSDWRIRSGVLIGLVLALGYLFFRSLWPSVSPPLRTHAALLSDCDKSIEELVIQYVPDAAEIVLETYQQFLSQLPKEVSVYVVCPSAKACQDLIGRLKEIKCRLVPLVTNHPITTWSRDRWLAFGPLEPGRPGLILSPREEIAARVWPQRQGDQRVAEDLAAFFKEKFESKRSALAFDGGDFVADSKTVFITPNVLLRNEGITVPSSIELKHVLEGILQKEVILLGKAPAHHAGMFMMPAGRKTMLVGDPSLASASLDCLQTRSAACPILHPDLSADSQSRFDAVAETARAAGYRVVRIPVVPDTDGRTYLTYLNVIIDQRDGQRIVYMPTYRKAEKLNRQAERIWQGLGYQVRRVDCTATYIHFGSLRCLVNVLKRA